MVERTNEQQKMLEKRKADLAERRRIELETAQQLEAQEEMGEELGKTYTSLQQEVPINDHNSLKKCKTDFWPILFYRENLVNFGYSLQKSRNFAKCFEILEISR